jgi:hypothetical protein
MDQGNKTSINKLEQSLKTVQQQLNSNKNEPTNHSFIISISVLSVIILALLAKILYDKIKKLFATLHIKS